jgi:large subunit ribosomal protein L6
MSRVGKIIRKIPAGVTMDLVGDELKIKGPKGELSQKLHPLVTVILENDTVRVAIKNENKKEEKALWGTFSSLIGGMIKGVTEGFKKQLEVNGVGYKVAMKGDDLHIEIGFSHPVEFKCPTGIKFSVEKNVITVEGFDKQLVGETAAQIRKIRKPEPYKGKGIKYMDEVIRRKAGKTSAKGE